MWGPKKVYIYNIIQTLRFRTLDFQKLVILVLFTTVVCCLSFFHILDVRDCMTTHLHRLTPAITMILKLKGTLGIGCSRYSGGFSHIKPFGSAMVLPRFGHFPPTTAITVDSQHLWPAPELRWHLVVRNQGHTAAWREVSNPHPAEGRRAPARTSSVKHLGIVSWSPEICLFSPYKPYEDPLTLVLSPYVPALEHPPCGDGQRYIFCWRHFPRSRRNGSSNHEKLPFSRK